MLLDGRALADTLLARAKARLQAASSARRAPGLAVIQVGSRPDSSRYVAMKSKAAAKVGVDSSMSVKLPDGAQEADVIAAVSRLNEEPSVDSILVQLPLPKGMDQERVLQGIRVDKDVDGFHPYNMGRLARYGELARQRVYPSAIPDVNVPCTPLGVVALLDHYQIPIQGKRAVILGRSNIVGLPLSLMLLHRDATVTTAHSHTDNAADLVRDADIVVAAIGRPKTVLASWVKPGATVIDVGINFDAFGKMVGDVDFDAVSKVAGAITPVPGGVGPLTVAMLIQSCVNSFLKTL